VEEGGVLLVNIQLKIRVAVKIIRLYLNNFIADGFCHEQVTLNPTWLNASAYYTTKAIGRKSFVTF
jgi:hypothetical protein